MLDAAARRDARDGGVFVAAHDLRVEAERAQACDALACFGTQLVGEAECREQAARIAETDPAFAVEPARQLPRRPRSEASAANGGMTDTQASFADGSLEALACHDLDVARRGAAGAGGQEGARDRVLRHALEGERERQAFGLGHVREQHALPRRVSAPSSACPSCPTTRGSPWRASRVASECATSTPRRASAERGGGDRGRRRERERAGAGDDQHGQRRRERARRIDEPPDGEHHGRADQDPAQEPRGGAVGRLGESRTLRLRALEQRNDAGQHGLVRDGFDPHR